LRFFEFSSVIFLAQNIKYCHGVFELLMQRNGKKRDETKSKEQKRQKKTSPPKHGFSQKLPLLSNAQNRHKRGGGRKKGTCPPHLVAICYICQMRYALRSFSSTFSSAPLAPRWTRSGYRGSETRDAPPLRFVSCLCGCGCVSQQPAAIKGFRQLVLGLKNITKHKAKARACK
jgi:hypothetical protein